MISNYRPKWCFTVVTVSFKFSGEQLPKSKKWSLEISSLDDVVDGEVVDSNASAGEVVVEIVVVVVG